MIASRLRAIVGEGQWSLLVEYLRGLSNTNFRTAGYILSEDLMPRMSDDDFWSLLTLLYNLNAKAFLVTCMKAAVTRIGNLQHPMAEALWRQIATNDIDAAKTLQTLLPHIKDDVSGARHLLDVMLGNDARKRISVLLKVNTPLACYLLLNAMRMVELDRALLIRTTYFLIKRGDALSFNLASLFRAFFGLEEVHGTFSLTLQPYELARLETNYEAFLTKVVTSI